MLRPCDLTLGNDVWLYCPESHKTEHHSRNRVIAIGPQAQEVIRPYLLREKTAYCFSPRESEEKRRALQHSARATPLRYGNSPGTNRKQRPKRSAGERYSTDSYRRAIHRACRQLNKKRREEAEAEGEEGRSTWHARGRPNRRCFLELLPTAFVVSCWNATFAPTWRTPVDSAPAIRRQNRLGSSRN